MIQWGNPGQAESFSTPLDLFIAAVGARTLHEACSCDHRAVEQELRPRAAVAAATGGLRWMNTTPQDQSGTRSHSRSFFVQKQWAAEPLCCSLLWLSGLEPFKVTLLDIRKHFKYITATQTGLSFFMCRLCPFTFWALFMENCSLNFQNVWRCYWVCFHLPFILVDHNASLYRAKLWLLPVKG